MPLSNTLYPNAYAASMYSEALSSVDTVIQLAILAAMRTAIAAGNKTCTVSVAGLLPRQIQDQMNILQNQGFGVSHVTTTLVITW